MNNRKVLLPALLLSLVLFSLAVVFFPFKSSSGQLQKRKLPKKERTLVRDRQEMDMTKDPKLGYIPFERLEVAKRYTRTLIGKQKLGTPAKAAISGVSWTNQGPVNVGGRTRAIMFDPNDGDRERVFAGGVSGGLWVNEDITSNVSPWTRINDFLPNLTITSLAFDPNNTNTFYAATGEGYSQVTPGNGIYISTDGGMNWSLMPNSEDFRYISEIKVRDESGTSVIYVASLSKYVGNQIQGGSSVYLGTDGLFRSDNGGTTWTQVLPDADGGDPPSVDEVEIDAAGNLWASTGINSFDQKGGDIYTCSTGCDNSSNWTKKFDASANGYTDVDRMVIALAPSSANHIYAVGAYEAGGHEDVALFVKSTDGGNTWSSLPIPLNYDLDNCTTIPNQHFTNEQGTYDLVLTVHPTDPDYVLMGGIDLYRTLNGFSTVEHIGSWYAGAAPCDQEIHADHHAIVWRPGSTNEVVFGNDGGIYYSTNAGNSAVAAPTFSHHVLDYNVSQIYAVDISPTAGASEYLAGLQDNGTQDWDTGSGGLTSEAVGGDGGYAHIDQDEPMIQIAAYIFNDFTVTTDEWATKTQITPIPQTGRFINPSDYDDTNNILYSASNTDQLCRLSGVGTTNLLTDGISIGGDALGGSKATSIRVDRNVPTTIYVGTDNGEVFRITNANSGSPSSTSISTGLPSGTWISSIDVEQSNSNHLLVTISNYGTASIWESTDGGSSWDNVEGNLPDMPVRWGIFSPVNADQVFLATDLGVWSTDDLDGAGTDWGVTNTGLANVRTDMIRYRPADNTLIVGTFGRGIYTFTLPAIGEKYVAISGLRLQGAMPGSGTVMRTDITAQLPLSDPYGLGVAASSVPANAVDWVKIELRSGLLPSLATTVEGATAAFLLEDGTVKAPDGNDPKFTSLPDGNYYVAIQHRNHLGVITSSEIALTAGTQSLDMASATLWTNPLILTNAPATTVNGVKALWAGDANGNGTVTYNGGSNDRDAILAELDFDALDVDMTYQSEDLNLNGTTSYNGGSNDRDLILQVLGFSISASKAAHLP